LNSKKKLTDIGFIGFSWIKGIPIRREVFFNGYLDLRLMFVEHQSTSECKDNPAQYGTQAHYCLFFVLLYLLVYS